MIRRVRKNYMKTVIPFIIALLILSGLALFLSLSVLFIILTVLFLIFLNKGRARDTM